MIKHAENMIDDFPKKLKSADVAKTPAGNDLLNQDQGRKLPADRAESRHAMVAKGSFLCKRARLDTQPTIAASCARVKDPSEADWGELVRLMKHLSGSKKRRLTLSAG